ncbi:glycerol channel [Tieghemiomyces parasiticus]|uniref:Glycerol channel n=1 Tax=Tieghemiomyces parasiticus TaxID=78921 RepID=A0A9W8DYQ4_9FUNG|nr:glycerol channel [Tieghemiomyces parasiticus]
MGTQMGQRPAGPIYDTAQNLHPSSAAPPGPNNYGARAANTGPRYPTDDGAYGAPQMTTGAGYRPPGADADYGAPLGTKLEADAYGGPGVNPQGYASEATIAHNQQGGRVDDADYYAGRSGPYTNSMKRKLSLIPMRNARWHSRGFPNRFFEWWHRLRVRYRDYLAEFFGTAVLVFLGDSAVATAVLFPRVANSAPWLVISFGWGFALTFALFVSAGVSGGHLNPAVTTTSAALRGFPLRKVPGYIAAQLLGGFCGAGLVYGLFHSSIHNLDGGIRHTVGPTATANIFATYPQPWITVGTGFMAEVFGTAVLLFCIYGITDERNMPGTAYAPLAIGFILTTIGLNLGFQTGFAVNPARDLGPRALTSAAGYGAQPWHAYSHYAWVPAVAPFAGGLIGGLLYDFFVNHPRLGSTDSDIVSDLEGANEYPDGFDERRPNHGHHHGHHHHR